MSVVCSHEPQSDCRYRLFAAGCRGVIKCGGRLAGATAAGTTGGACASAGNVTLGCADSCGAAGTGAPGAPIADNLPVAATGSAGTSSLTDAPPSAGPIDAVRRLTD